MRAEPGRSVTSKVLALLDAFSPATPALTLSELARRTGLPLPTAYRRAAELVAWGALERGDDGRYRIGLRLWEVGSLAPRGLGLRELALPVMEDLYEVTHENVQLAVRQDLELVFIERIAGRQAVPVLTRVGGRFALHATGVGLVLLAHAPVEVQEQVLAAPLERYTELTIIDPKRLRSYLAEVRRVGYAVSDRQVTMDALSVAAPIRVPEGVVAAISLVVAHDRADPVALAPLVQAAGRVVSRALSSSTPPRRLM
ncbi:IclR family transcriptional regulator [Micromonospora sp. NBC_00860]|uniref:IclR family transcriptional regulator n=1 Tax=Micromonospora sp. NBC_00860 TaxID=2975980 RepID=UPI0038659692|nr:IclR family transcriptional regulator [Micromonospora sp. NBC_00860]